MAICFFIYALIALFSTVWLLVTYVEESTVKIKVESFRSVYSILRDKTILLLFLGIVFVVGIDVGINTTAPKILIERCYLNSITAGYGPSMYFALRTLGTFLGAFILAKSSASKFFKINIVFGLLAMVWLLFAHNLYVILAIYGAIGFSISNIFAILFSMAMQARPDKRNEISGLMITGVFGGAVLPFLMGILSDLIGNQMGSVIILIGGNLYLTYAAFSLSKSASG